MNREQTINNLMENMGSLMKLMGKSQMPIPHKDGPTKAQVGVLFMVSHLGAQTLKELAIRLEMTSSAATQLVDALVKDKLLTRTEDRNDRRKIQLALTAKGQVKLKLAKQERIKFLAKLLEPLTPQDLQSLELIQQKIIKGFQPHAGK